MISVPDDIFAEDHEIRLNKAEILTQEIKLAVETLTGKELDKTISYFLDKIKELANAQLAIKSEEEFMQELDQRTKQ